MLNYDHNYRLIWKIVTLSRVKKWSAEILPRILSSIDLEDLFFLVGNMVCLDKDGNKVARDNFMSLMTDCDHRQTLVQDLITKNNQLK